jgi:rsbT co-antagonist protein RsbR
MSEYKDIARAVFSNLDIIAWATDAQGVIVLSEGKALQAIGLSPGQLVGVNVLELYRDDPATLAALQRALAGEAHRSVGIQGGRALDTQFTPMLGAAGELVGMAGLTIDITERVAAQEKIDRQTEALRKQAELLDLAHDAILIRDLDGTISYWNRGAERLYGYAQASAIGRTSHALLGTRFPAALPEIERQLLTTGFWEGELVHTRADGREVDVASRWVLKRDEHGAAGTVLEINSDITARKQAELAEARRQETIRAQALAIQELSTPLIPITDEILVLPLIGTIDSMRARQVLQAILAGAASSRARWVILDITGVAVVDTAVAEAILRAGQAARLLGTEVILTGIRPEVAQTLVQLGANLEHITTRGTLQSGIAHALGKRSLSH